MGAFMPEEVGAKVVVERRLNPAIIEGVFSIEVEDWRGEIKPIDQGVQVLYTLILLFLLELASHAVPLILYTNNDFAHSPVKVFNSRFLSFLSRHAMMPVQLSFTSFLFPYARRLSQKTLQWFI